MRVLAVDDDDLMLILTAHQLRRAGHTVDTAGSGEAAVICAQATAYDAIISDWDMPGMTGPDLCRAVRTGAAGPAKTRFVLMTATHTPTARAEAEAAGIDAFLPKPCPPDQLRAALCVVPGTAE